MKSGTAYVAEIGDDDYFLTGRFDGHWERGDGGFEQLDDRRAAARSGVRVPRR